MRTVRVHVCCWLRRVEHDVADELAVEDCFDAEVEVGLWAGDGRNAADGKKRRGWRSARNRWGVRAFHTYCFSTVPCCTAKGASTPDFVVQVAQAFELSL